MGEVKPSFKIQCTLLLVIYIASGIIQGKPRDKAAVADQADALTTHLDAGWDLLRKPQYVLKRHKRVVTGLKNLRDLCPTSALIGSSYKDPLVRAKYKCFGFIDTVCRTSHASCTSAIVPHGYTKSEPNNQKVVSITVHGSQQFVFQTIDCRCAC